MVTMAAYDENRAELGEIRPVVRELAAKLSEDRWKIEQFSGLEKMRAWLENLPLLDMLLYDVTNREALAYLRQIRKEYRTAGLLILADVNTSPMTYMRPEIDTKEGSVRVPYDKIYYFEAREKKIYVCAGNEEFGFYHTMDKLSEELPEHFLRCHRGFVVNSLKIRKVMLSQNVIRLADGFEVPLSRSYKADLKEFGR